MIRLTQKSNLVFQSPTRIAIVKTLVFDDLASDLTMIVGVDGQVDDGERAASNVQEDHDQGAALALALAQMTTPTDHPMERLVIAYLPISCNSYVVTSFPLEKIVLAHQLNELSRIGLR
jgi:hypothetical protein